jgi:hypothetical protein
MAKRLPRIGERCDRGVSDAVVELDSRRMLQAIASNSALSVPLRLA